MKKKSVPFSYGAAATVGGHERRRLRPAVRAVPHHIRALSALLGGDLPPGATRGSRPGPGPAPRAAASVFFREPRSVRRPRRVLGRRRLAAGRANFMTDSNRGSEGAHSRTRRILEACAARALALCACVLAAFFAKYGGRCFSRCADSPRVSGRRKKLREVGTVTAVCALCFSARAAVVAAEAVALGRRGGKGGFLDAAHPAAPAADVAYYAACELLPPRRRWSCCGSSLRNQGARARRCRQSRRKRDDTIFVR